MQAIFNSTYEPHTHSPFSSPTPPSTPFLFILVYPLVGIISSPRRPPPPPGKTKISSRGIDTSENRAGGIESHTHSYHVSIAPFPSYEKEKRELPHKRWKMPLLLLLLPCVLTKSHPLFHVLRMTQNLSGFSSMAAIFL